jgi:hypothetical protein
MMLILFAMTLFAIVVSTTVNFENFLRYMGGAIMKESGAK